MKRELFDIWETETDRPILRWHVQMVNYIAHFPSEELAISFVAATKKAREQAAKSVTR